MSFVGLFAILILCLSGYFEVIGSFLCTETHADFVEGIGQTIVCDDINQFLVSVAESLSGLS